MNLSRNIKHQGGFTLVELMISMAFVSVLLIIIASSLIYISNVFSRGMTIRDLNQLGRSTIDDMRRTIAATSEIKAENIHSEESGYLCTGKYSYVWNYGSAFDGDTVKATAIRYTDGTPVRFARFSDMDAQICRDLSGSNTEGATNARLVKSRATELLTKGDRDLVLGRLEVKPIAVDAGIGQALYRVDLVLRTNDESQLILNEDRCANPREVQNRRENGDTVNGTDEYCAVNKFSFIARAGSKT